VTPADPLQLELQPSDSIRMQVDTPRAVARHNSVLVSTGFGSLTKDVNDVYRKGGKGKTNKKVVDKANSVINGALHPAEAARESISNARGVLRIHNVGLKPLLGNAIGALKMERSGLGNGGLGGLLGKQRAVLGGSGKGSFGGLVNAPISATGNGRLSKMLGKKPYLRSVLYQRRGGKQKSARAKDHSKLVPAALGAMVQAKAASGGG